MDKPPSYSLQVLAGVDRGARLDIGDRIRTIGRGRDADLVLADRSVSRHHLQAAASRDALHIVTCDGAAPFIKDGEPLRSLDAQSGDRVLIGNTELLVLLTERGAVGDRTDVERSDVTTLLTGAALDVRGLAAIFALVELLDSAADLGALRECLLAWGRLHAEASDVALDLGEDVDAPPASPRATDVLVRPDAGSMRVTVPAHTSASGWISFLVAGTSVSDSTRRLLVVAGRLVASRLSQLRVQRVAEEERSSLRTMALGSARAFLGTSGLAGKIAQLVPRLGATNTVVLLTGETGTGKSFVARLIHESSGRAAEPLRIVNCAAIPESLIESELFGHERGAFTGATTARAGALEAAGDGTLFLDEIGELPMASQAKLLRVLEDRQFERLGSNRTVELRARVIAATNRDLAEMVAENLFRRDLYFRVSVVNVRIPPLRERAEDIPVLARYILADLCATAARRIDGISREAETLLASHSWPGNVRELRNVLEYAVVMGDGERVQPSDFPESMRLAPSDGGVLSSESDPFLVRLPMALAALEQKAIEAALRATNDNRSRAAGLLGIPRSSLYSKLGPPKR